MKKRIWLLIIIIIIIPLFWFLWVSIRPHLGYNCNELIVTVESPLNQDLLTIETGVFTIGRESDRELFDVKTELVYKSKEIKQIANDYGENDFLIKYSDSYYFQFRHFKTRGTPRDTYNFHLFQEEDKILIRVHIDGTDPINFIGILNLIDNSDSLLYNYPEKGSYEYKEIEAFKKRYKNTSKE